MNWPEISAISTHAPVPQKLLRCQFGWLVFTDMALAFPIGMVKRTTGRLLGGLRHGLGHPRSWIRRRMKAIVSSSLSAAFQSF